VPLRPLLGHNARGEWGRQQFSAAEAVVQLGRVLIAKVCGDGLVGQLQQTEHLQLVLQELSPLGNGLRLPQPPEPAPGVHAGVGCGDVAQVFVEPGPLRLGAHALDDAHLIAVLQRPVERVEQVIDVDGVAAVAQFSVNPVGKVDGCAPFGQIERVALGRVDANLVAQHVLQGALHAHRRVVRLHTDAVLHVGEERAQMFGHTVDRQGRTGVVPAGQDANLCSSLHINGAHADLEWLAVVVNHRCMQRLIEVLALD